MEFDAQPARSVKMGNIAKIAKVNNRETSKFEITAVSLRGITVSVVKAKTTSKTGTIWKNFLSAFSGIMVSLKSSFTKSATGCRMPPIRPAY